MKKFLLTIITALIIFFTQAQTNLTTAADFTVTDIHGNIHNLFNYLDNGKHVILDFFFTTCSACIASVPTLNQAYTDYGCNTGQVVFISIDNGDSDTEVLQYENSYAGLLPSVSGNDGGGNAVVLAYGIGAYPTVVLIAPDRTILEQDIYPVSNIVSALPNAGLNVASCAVMPSWDCVGNTCVDPGTGMGIYTDQATCDAVCGVSAIKEHTKKKELLRITDQLGRETKNINNEFLFYIYNDGTVEERIVIE
jgi:thiol-disulfide isomerase/thioredoxin